MSKHDLDISSSTRGKPRGKTSVRTLLVNRDSCVGILCVYHSAFPQAVVLVECKAMMFSVGEL